jgi:hypothetical protein
MPISRMCSSLTRHPHLKQGHGHGFVSTRLRHTFALPDLAAARTTET